MIADSGAQALPPARATVLPWLRGNSSRASTLPACSALGPPASAAQYSCRREPCTGRSAWLLLGRACLYAWIEHRSFGIAAARQGLPVRLDRAPLVRHGCCSAGLACTLGSSTAARSSVRHSQGLKARPHALNRFTLARKRFIAHFLPSPRPLRPANVPRALPPACRPTISVPPPTPSPPASVPIS